MARTIQDGDDASAYGATIAAMRSQNVSTIVLATEYAQALPLMATADSQGYYPEWVLPTPYGLDFNFIGLILPQGQMRHAFGFSMWLLPPPFSQTDCYRAYKEMDPANVPDDNAWNLFFPMVLQIVNGIQMAGPDLNPHTFAEGLFRMGKRFYPEIWSVGGGFAPGDCTYVEDFGEIWWDPQAQAYRWTRNGSRFVLGATPPGDGGLFQEGIMSALQQ